MFHYFIETLNSKLQKVKCIFSSTNRKGFFFFFNYSEIGPANRAQFSGIWMLIHLS